MSYKNKILLFIFLFFSIKAFSKEDFSYKENGIKIENNYYTFPLQTKIGAIYRNNDFSIFPFLGASFENEDNFFSNAFAGIDLIYKRFRLNNSFYYELFPSLVNNDFDIYKYTLELGYKNDFYKINIPVSVGKKNFTFENGLLDKQKFFSIKLIFNSLIFDKGFVQITDTFETQLVSLYNQKFNFYKINFELPCTFYTQNFDFGIKYKFNFVKELNLQDNTPLEKYKTSYSYSNVTNRLPFSKENKNLQLSHIIEFEQRYYPFRNKNLSSSFFVSLFENIGFGFDKENNADFLYQYGIGLGYNLYNCVPFTVQIGLNQEKQAILFIGVVSNITHLP